MINEEVKEKIGDISDYIIERGVTNGIYWTRWKSGWLEQFGRCNGVAYNNTTVNVTFAKPFKDTNYYATSNPIDYSVGNTWNVSSRVSNLTTTSMVVRGGKNNDGYWNSTISWYACGYGLEN